MNFRGLTGAKACGASNPPAPVGSRGQNLLALLSFVYVLGWYL